VQTSANLSVNVTDTPSALPPGAWLTYTVSIANLGPSDALGVIMTDTLPSSYIFNSVSPLAGSCTGTSVIRCTLGTIPALQTATVTISGWVNSVTPLGSIFNTAVASSTTSDSNAGNNTDTEETQISNTLADVGVTISAQPSPVVAGRPITFTIEVTNHGPSNASGIQLADILPGEVTFVSITTSQGVCSGTSSISCSLGAIGAGNKATLTLRATVRASAVGYVVNTVTITSGTADPISTNDSAASTTPISTLADLSISKVDQPDPVTAGTLITYTLNLSNHGPSDAAGVTVTDALPSSLVFQSAQASQGTCASESSVSCTLGTLPNGGSAWVQIVAQVRSSAAGTITNQASVSASTTDNLSSNNTATQTTTVDTRADLSVTKTDNLDPVVAGASVFTYTITVSNAGPSDSANVSVADSLPSGVSYLAATPSAGSCSLVGGSVVVCSLGTVTAEASQTVRIRVVVNAPTTGLLSNTVSATTNTTDSNSANNTDTEGTTVTTSADVRITSMLDIPDPVAAGRILTYTITIGNSGPSTASGVTLTDAIPAGVSFRAVTATQGSCSGTTTVTCSLGTIHPGNTAQVVVSVNVLPSTTQNIQNTATVSANPPDPLGTNNSASTITVVSPLADLAITQTDAPDPVASGAVITYTLTVVNNGPSNAAGVSVVNTLPAGLTYLSSTPPTAGCVHTTQVVTCTLGSVNAGASQVVQISARANLSIAGVVTNQAVVSSATTEAVPANNTSAQNTTVADTTQPHVIWQLPVTNQQRFDVGSQSVLLRVSASDNVGVAYVRFSYYDYVQGKTVVIGDDFSAPYEWAFDTRVLNPKFNQINALAYDAAGNLSPFATDNSYIFLYYTQTEFKLYLPLILRNP
jgi:uncharacterized repeat protein (TIGR01451 family)